MQTDIMEKKCQFFTQSREREREVADTHLARNREDARQRDIHRERKCDRKSYVEKAR